MYKDVNIHYLAALFLIALFPMIHCGNKSSEGTQGASFDPKINAPLNNSSNDGSGSGSGSGGGSQGSGTQNENPAPIISLVEDPASGPIDGGTMITIDGQNFVAGAVVTLDDTICSVSSLTATRIVCMTDAHAEGAVDVTVTNLDKQFFVLHNGFTYEPPCDPNIQQCHSV